MICLRDGLVCVTIPSSRAPKVYAPEAFRPTLLNLCHDNPMAGHFSADKTAHRVAAQWWWPHFRQDVAQYCAQCHKCATVNLPKDKKPAPMRHLPFPSAFNDRVQADLLGPLKEGTQHGNTYLLVMTDAYSKYMELVALPNKRSDTVACAIVDGWISQHGTF
jgi:hypothetical protein